MAGGALAACQDDTIRPVAVLEAGDSADQVLYGVTTLIAPEGVRRHRLQADTAMVYNATGLYDLRGVHLTFYDPAGVEMSVLTADSGVYRLNTGAMEAKGNVVVESVDGKILRTSYLQYDRDANELSTDQFFTYLTDGGTIEGNGFRSDPNFTFTVTDQPRGGQDGDAPGTMLLPGQDP
jgi:LPS export ABC transporter protein LptC